MFRRIPMLMKRTCLLTKSLNPFLHHSLLLLLKSEQLFIQPIAHIISGLHCYSTQDQRSEPVVEFQVQSKQECEDKRVFM